MLKTLNYTNTNYPFGMPMPNRSLIPDSAKFTYVNDMIADAYICNENFEGATVVSGSVNGWGPSVSAVLTIDHSSTDRLKVDVTTLYDGTQYYFTTVAGRTYNVSLGLDTGSAGIVGVVVYPHNPYGSPLPHSVPNNAHARCPHLRARAVMKWKRNL